MATIDLGTPRPAPQGVLDALPRRLALTLPELRLAAEKAGGAPLPFDLVPPPEADPLEGRLGQTRTSLEDRAYAAALAALHDPAESLARRGLLNDDVLDQGVAGAVGLLATPTVAVDLDVCVGSTRARAWHRQSGDAVAALATVDGIVFELAWFETPMWAAELARAGMLPEDLDTRRTSMPELVDAPYELLDAAGEAVRSGRSDLLPVLAAQHAGQVRDADGRVVADADVTSLLSALAIETRGRLRALGADVSGDVTTVVGVVSWVLLGDGWHSLRPHTEGDDHRVEVRRVEPADLASDLAFVLAEVTA